MSFMMTFQKLLSRIMILSRVTLIVTVLCLAGCDALFIKQIKLQRSIDFSQIKTHELDIKKLVLEIDGFALKNNMNCRTEQKVLRYCDKQPQTLVAFEDKSGFVVCLFVLGTGWEENKYLSLMEMLEKSLINALPDRKFEISPSDELPECTIPKR